MAIRASNFWDVVHLVRVDRDAMISGWDIGDRCAE